MAWRPFQLTPSRKATLSFSLHILLHFISTHAFTEGDFFQTLIHSLHLPFQLTPSRKATPFSDFHLHFSGISTHAFTEGDYNGAGNRNRDDISTHAFTEGDPWLHFSWFPAEHFNSRLHGRRRKRKNREAQKNLFQLTPSRKATPP